MPAVRRTPPTVGLLEASPLSSPSADLPDESRRNEHAPWISAARRSNRRSAAVVTRLGLLALAFIVFLLWHGAGHGDSSGGEREDELGDLAAAAAAAAARALAGEAPALHGPVHKAGPLDESRWHPRHTDDINRNWGMWMKRRRQLAPQHRPSVLSPQVFPGCAVLANHAYRFIFVRHPKCASSALLHHFTLCFEARATKSCLEPWNGSPTSSVANASSADIQAMWRDYFVFTVVRNPLARAVSSYKFVLSATVANEGCSNRMDWDGFCRDPLLAGEVCRRHATCCPFGPLFAWSHVIDQARCMTTLDGGLAVDYVARMENIDEDMPHLFAEINARRPADLPALEAPSSVKKVLPSNAREDPSQGEGCASAGGAPKRHRAADGPAFFFAVAGNFTGVVAKESAYCGLPDFFGGQHEHCLRSVRRAYGADLRLLYPEAPAAAETRQRAAGEAAASVAGGGGAAEAGGGAAGGEGALAAESEAAAAAPTEGAGLAGVGGEGASGARRRHSARRHAG